MNGCVIGLCVSLKIIFFRPMGIAEFGNLSLFFLVILNNSCYLHIGFLHITTTPVHFVLLALPIKARILCLDSL